MAMTRVSVEVPSELVGPVRETVLLLYQATAESLQLSLRAHSEGRGSLEEVGVHRARLAELDELLGSLGGHAERPGPPAARPGPPAAARSRPRRLSAPAELLHDAFYGALLDAGERLSVTVDRAWRGELPLERVQESAAEVLALHRLLRLLELRAGRPTTDHEEIRRWVEAHGGSPARVRGTGEADDPGVLRIDFPGGSGEEQLEPISWEEWFGKFDESELAFLYQEQKAGGGDSTFFKLVRRDGA
jgi:hypothetical protein